MPFGLGDAFITIRPTIASGFENAVGTAVGHIFSGLSNRVEELGRDLTRKLTVPITIGTAANITQFQALDAKLRETGTLFSATGERGQRLWREFRVGVSEVSDEVGLLEQNISQGLYQAISAGIPKSNVFEFMDVASRAAVGGALDVTVAVNGLTTAVNAFAAQGLDAEEAADILFRGVARGKTTFEELSQEMATAAPLAAQANVSFAEFIAILATMTLSGTTTAESVTQTRAAINGLLRPTEEMTAIMKQAGFESQETAVRQLGLQGALALVVEAVDGEVGALIRLLGGAEAANAALQVTGTNAERFETIFRDTASATGAMNAAFRNMNEGAGRTFGRMIAQVDRFGSSMGELAFQIVGPGIEFITNVLQSVNNAMDKLRDAPPIIRQLATGFVFLTAAVGPALLIGSKLLGLFGFQMAARFARSGAAITSLGGIVKVFSGGLAIMLSRLTGLIPGLEVVTRRLRAFGLRGVTPAISAVKGFAGALGLIAVGAIAYIAWLQRMEKQVKEIQDSQRIAAVGAEILADSLGLVVKPAQELARIGEIDMAFRIANRENIEILREARNDADLLEGRLVQFGFQLVNLGNTPEEAFDAVRQLAEEAGIEIPVGFTVEDLNFRNLREAVLDEARRLADSPELQALFGGFDEMRPDLGFTRQELAKTEGAIANVGEAVAKAFVENPYQAVTTLRLIEDILGKDFPGAVDLFGEAFLDALNVNDSLDITHRGVQDVTNVLNQLVDNGVLFRSELEKIPDVAEDINQSFGDIEPPLSEEEIQKQLDAVEGGFEHMQGVLEGIQERISDTFDEIHQSLVEGIPLWGQFEGAADLSVSETIASLQRYREAITSWAELNRELAGTIPEEVRAALNALPAENRAALAELAEGDPQAFNQLISEYETTFETVRSTAEDQFKVEIPGLIAEGNQEMLRELRAVEGNFGALGANAATAWKLKFRSIAEGWDNLVTFYGQKAVNALEGVWQVESPSKVAERIAANVGRGFERGLLGRSEQAESAARAYAGAAMGQMRSVVAPVSHTTVSRSFTQNIHNPTTENLVRDAERGLGVMATMDLILPVGG